MSPFPPALVISVVAVVGCVEAPLLEGEVRLIGAESALVVVDRGAGLADRFEGHAVRVDPESGALRDFALTTSATTVTFVGYACALERYGWLPGPLSTGLVPAGEAPLRLPPNAHSAVRVEGRRVVSAPPPRSLAQIEGHSPLLVASAPSVRDFHAGGSANVAGERVRVLPFGPRRAVLYVPDWGAQIFEPVETSTLANTFVFDAKGMVTFDGLVGLTAGSPSALVRLPAPDRSSYALSDRPALRGLAGGYEDGVAAYYSFDLVAGGLVRMTINGTVAVTRTFVPDIRIPSDEALDLVWTEPGHLYLVGVEAWPIELTSGRARPRPDLPGSRVAAGAGAMVVASAKGALIGPTHGRGPWLEWDCPLPDEVVGAAIDDRQVVIAGRDRLYLRTLGACGACREVQPSIPLAQVRDVILLPQDLVVIENAFSSANAIGTWVDRPAD